MEIAIPMNKPAKPAIAGVRILSLSPSIDFVAAMAAAVRHNYTDNIPYTFLMKPMRSSCSCSRCYKSASKDSSLSPPWFG